MPPFLARQREVLRSSSSFRLLFTSYLVSGLGTFLAVIALTVDVYDRTHSGTWVAALLIADFLPAVAIGLLLGPLVDRLSRKRLLVAADVVRLIVFVLLTFTVTPGQIVALALVAGVATGFARPAAYAGLPNLVSLEDLPRANALLRLAEQLTITVGTLLGGVIAAVAGPDPAYVVNAVSFGVSAVLLLRIPRALLQQGRTESRGLLAGPGRRLPARPSFPAAPRRAPLLEPGDDHDRVRQRVRGGAREGLVRCRQLRLRVAVRGERPRRGDRRTVRVDAARAARDDPPVRARDRPDGRR